MRALLACLMVLTVTLSGCLSVWDKRPDFQETETEVENAYLDLIDDVGDARAVNTRLVAYHNGVDDTGDPDAIPLGGYYTEIALQADRVYLARGSASGDDRGAFGGFSIIDIQDPSRPTFVGAYEAPTGSDIEVNKDETLAFFGTQRNSIEELSGRYGSTEDPQAAAPRGIHVVDLSDKTNPTQLAYYPIYPNGAHTITYLDHPDGNEYLIAATYDFTSNTVPSDEAPPAPVADPTGTAPDTLAATQRVIIYQIQPDPSEQAQEPLIPVGEYSVRDMAPSGEWYFPHDTYVEQHPLTGDVLMYVAYWDQGVHIVDISDPSRPTRMDSYDDFAPSDRKNIHFTRPLDIMPGNRHITVTEPEIVSADETGYIWLLDTTDPEDIQKAGPASYWTLPGEHIVQDLDFSPHNFDVRNGVIALAHNMAGVWFIDASDADNVQDPKTTGYYLPENTRDEAHRNTAYTWGTRWLDDRTVLVSDEGTGLHIVEYIAPGYP